jgi:REP element-mobilizing transposase RayT
MTASASIGVPAAAGPPPAPGDGTMSRPIRLPAALYRGPNRYFLTGCTRQRQPAFAAPGFAATARASLLHCADLAGFAITAYCLMPDHAHVLAETERDDAHLRALWYKWRQVTGFAWRRGGHPRLWQGRILGLRAPGGRFVSRRCRVHRAQPRARGPGGVAARLPVARVVAVHAGRADHRSAVAAAAVMPRLKPRPPGRHVEDDALASS